MALWTHPMPVLVFIVYLSFTPTRFCCSSPVFFFFHFLPAACCQSNQTFWVSLSCLWWLCLCLHVAVSFCFCLFPSRLPSVPSGSLSSSAAPLSSSFFKPSFVFFVHFLTNMVCFMCVVPGVGAAPLPCCYLPSFCMSCCLHGE